MAKYIGTECLVCNEKFKDDDDIVVCPECGTPYHRECYAKEGKCINIKLHEKNKSWSEERIESGAEMPKKCKFCNTENKPHSFICENCGASLIDKISFNDNTQNSENAQNKYGNGFQFNINDKYCGMNPEEKLDSDITLEEAADMIGSNVQYYLMLFKRMKDTGKKITLNVICILFPQFFFAYRKMWIEAIAVVVLEMLLSIPYLLYYLVGFAKGVIAESSEQISKNIIALANIDVDSTIFNLIFSISNYASLALSIFILLFANWMYYKHVQRKILKIKRKSHSADELKSNIIISGGTSILGIVLVLVLQLLLSAIFTIIVISFVNVLL